MRTENVRDKIGSATHWMRPSMLTDTHFGVDSDNNNMKENGQRLK